MRINTSADNIKIAQQRKFICMSCRKQPPEIEFSFKKSGVLCSSCFEAISHTIALGVLIYVPVSFLYFIYLYLTS